MSVTGDQSAPTPRTLSNAPMPDRVAHLPRNPAGYPIPWFAATLDDGTREFRVADADKRIDAYLFRRCWVCGGVLGVNVAFVIGPMCVVNRITAEPGGHRECARYSAMVCPFLAVPAMRRRDTDEVTAAVDAGLPALRDMCGQEDDPAVALAELDDQVTRAERWMVAA